MSKRQVIALLVILFLLQFLFLIWQVAPKYIVITHKESKTILIEQRGYDPRDPLSGAYMDIQSTRSAPETDATITDQLKPGKRVYVAYVPDGMDIYSPKCMSLQYPVPNMPPDAVTLRAKLISAEEKTFDLGLERFYCSQDKADEYSEFVRQHNFLRPFLRLKVSPENGEIFLDALVVGTFVLPSRFSTEK